MKKYIRRGSVFMLSILLAANLVGCSNYEKNTVPEEMDNDTGELVEGESLELKLGIEETWQAELAVGGNSVKIDAEVSIPDTNYMSILSLKETAYTNEKKEEILSVLCEGSDVYSFDELNAPKFYYETRVKIQSQIIEDLAKAKENDTSMVTSETCWTEEDEANYEQELDIWDELSASYHSAPETGDDPGNYDANTYYCQQGDEMMRIYFDPEEGIFSWVKDGIHTIKEGVSAADIISNNTDVTYTDNLCAITQENAVDEALSYIVSLGYSDFMVSEVLPLRWDKYDSVGNFVECWADGYQITFTRSVDGVAEDTCEYQITIGENEFTSKSCGEYIKVSINDTGIFNCGFSNIQEVEEVVTSDTLLLSFDEVCDTFLTILSSEDSNVITEDTKFNSLDLIYFLYEDEYTYLLPVWRLSYMSNVEYNKYNPIIYVLINAIDGSRIILNES